MSGLFDIREYGGSQHRAWEELAFQLRGAVGDVVETRKTRAPDGGVEWYDIFRDGHHEGFQAKFYADLPSALGDMRKSVTTVATSRPEMTRLTFVVPYDFTDHSTSKYESDQDRWDAAVARWKEGVAGADRLDFAILRGGEVLERLTRAEHAGRRAFWFGEVDLSWAWLEERWAEACAIAGERYTPRAHTAIDLEGDIAAACLADSYLCRLQAIVAKAVDEVIEAAPTWSERREELVADATRLRSAARAAISAVPSFDPAEIASAEAESTARLEVFFQQALDGSDSFDRFRLGRALSDLASVRQFLQGRQTHTAASGVLAISGSAGQGKTHLVLQTASDLLRSETPAIVLMGQRFSDGPWWPSVRDQLGIGDVELDRFLGAFSSLAEAAGTRGLIFIDALNESRDPRSWRAELPSLLDRISRYPWLGVVLTWRADYQDLILGENDLRVVRHPGLAGVEHEALVNYCELFEIPVPEVPVFDSAFSNPLFLRMYCEVLAKNPAAGQGSQGRSQIFTEFARLRARDVLDRLQLTPASPVIQQAIDQLADALIAAGGRAVPRASFEPAVNALVPQRTTWPDTLFGAMRSTGLVETAPTFDGNEVVSFPFQAFSEHLVVGRLLDRLTDETSGLSDASREAIAGLPQFWRSAAVLLPERYGIELIDIVDGVGDSWRLEEVTANSLVDRNPSAFDARAEALLDRALGDEYWGGRVLEVVFALASRNDHPCNALWLHRRLLASSMPDRDAWWGILTFDVLEESATFQRMVAWSTRGDIRSSDQQVVLSALPMAWMLVSPNRRLRDHTTKVLVELFRSRLAALRGLLILFQGVDDPYVIERLLLIAYGSIMRGGDQDQVGATALAAEVLRYFEEDLLPVNVLARDSGRGVVTWAGSRGLVSDSAVDRVAPPYGASPPEEPPTADELSANYGHLDTSPPQWRCSAILSSCLDWMGDFNKYVIASDVDAFSLHPLEGPAPTGRAQDDPLGEVDADWAGRWVAWKAITRGWTVERFADFEHSRDLHSDRDAHKAERFGKKYQWQALHELLARLADTFHPSIQWDDDAKAYEGPWGWFGRDLDPTLPASDNVDGQLVPMVALDSAVAPWIPAAPNLEAACRCRKRVVRVSCCSCASCEGVRPRRSWWGRVLCGRGGGATAVFRRRGCIR